MAMADLGGSSYSFNTSTCPTLDNNTLCLPPTSLAGFPPVRKATWLSFLSISPPVVEAENFKIPRPKNPFIIFRTEFARLHHNPRGSRPRRVGVKVLGRTVSGKAADAWRMLSPAERQRYQHLAELEKEKHARDYPNYQYRPKRRENGTRRRTPPSALDRRHPSPALTIRTAHNTPAASDALTLSPPPEQPPSSPEEEQQQPAVDPAVKADRRRSSSVPVTSGEHLYTSTLWAATEEPAQERWERTERWERPLQSKRRSRSVTQEWVNLAPTFQAPEPVFFDPRSPQTAFFPQTVYSTPFRVISPSSHFNAHPTPLFPAHHMSPLTAVASSLAGWNGEPAPSTIAPLAPQPVRVTAPSWLASPQPAHKYEPASPEFETKDPLTPLASEFEWPLDPTSQYVFAHPGADTIISHAKGGSDPTDYAALQEYQHGLQNRIHHTEVDFNLFTFDSSDDLRY
ncbi:hypothetical protein C8R43DRAFT_594107 [Mycena crocata]|nr:hypothetical protein C8R43DRAFT_594107 [Mycena crocata]